MLLFFFDIIIFGFPNVNILHVAPAWKNVVNFLFFFSEHFIVYYSPAVSEVKNESVSNVLKQLVDQKGNLSAPTVFW